MSGSWPSRYLLTASSAARLRLGIDRGGDLQALRVQRLLVDVEQVEQLAGDLALDQPVGTRGLALHAGLVRRHRGREHLRRALTRGQRPDGDHPVEHPAPPFFGALRVDGRVEAGRPLDQRGQQRALGDGELLDGLVEVGLRRRADAVRAAAEVDDVQISLQHLIFRPFAGHLRRDDQLFGLADDAADAGALGTHQRVLDVLLRDRRTALCVAAEQVVLHRARETAEREARDWSRSHGLRRPSPHRARAGAPG